MDLSELDPLELHDSSAAQRAAVRIISMADAEYPPALRDLSHPPSPLWIAGDLATLASPVVAIVGTRNATEYGLRVTRELASMLSRAGACIVSGMARGIDAAAHRATLAQGGRTVAVLGTGVDVPYPVGHRELQSAIARRGLVVSEFPLGARPHKGSFPRRNRIIAALASVTIVVEAPVKSGALNTAKQALELGRDVAIVPGPIDSPQSLGSNDFAREGAHVITSMADALMLTGLRPPARVPERLLTPAEERVLAELRRGSADLDALASRIALPSRECMQVVTALELAGMIECLMTGEIRVR